MALLDQLSNIDLPCTIIGADEIELLRILQIGGAVRASIPQQSRTLHGYRQDPATLLAITPAGRGLLRSFP